MEQDETAADRGALFAHLRPVLDGSPPPLPWVEMAAGLGTTEGALKVAAHRLKVRFRECLCAEARETLPADGRCGDELAELLRALSGSSPGVSGNSATPV